MIDNDTDDHEFTNALAAYAAPIRDDGFSQHVIMLAYPPQNTQALKRLMICVAGLLAACVAVPRLGGIVSLIATLEVFEISTLHDFPYAESLSGMAMLMVLVVLFGGLCGCFTYGSFAGGDDV